jgi:hypothetical protein
MRAGEADDGAVAGRGRRRAPALRALGALAVLAALLVFVTGAFDGPAPTPQAIDRRAGRAEVLGEQVTRDEVTAGTSTTTTTVTTAPPPPTTTTTVAPAPPVPAAAAVSRPAVSTSCTEALAYLAAHQAPGFTDSCADGSAFGHLGVTCVNQAGMCEGRRYIHIACPAPFVYMNEAHNSWTLTGTGSGIDPYGQGRDAERAACASHR